MIAIGSDKNESLVGNNEANFLDGNLGDDTLVGGSANDYLRGGDDYPTSGLEFATGLGHDSLVGGAGDDTLDGGYGKDTLLGGAGNDLLDGGDLVYLDNSFYSGADLFITDRLVGGAGNDTYIVDSAGDVVVEAAGEGTDEVQAHASFTLPANVEKLVLLGDSALRGTGNTLANALTGNSSANTLSGGSGNDTLNPGTGVDVVKGDGGSDLLLIDWSALAGATITSSVRADGTGSAASYSGSYTAKNSAGDVLSSVAFDGIESVRLNGKLVDLNASPAAPGITIKRASSEAFTTETGGAVQYSVVLDTAPFENVTLQFTSSDPGEGKINTPSLRFTPQNWATPQTLTIEGVDDYLDDDDVAYSVNGKVVTGDLNYNRLTIRRINLVNNDDGEDTPVNFKGTSEVDYFTGKNGNDIIYGAADQDRLSGGRGDDQIYGEQDNDRLYGELGEDEMYGGYGDDMLDGGEGQDTLFGEQGRDTLIGGAGNDYLDGGFLNDSMSGGAGNDTYFVDSAGDVINDLGASSDVDTVLVIQTISYTLPANVENASVTASGDSNLTGNTLNNALTGNADKNVLDGGVGDDKLSGGLGADSLLGGTGNDWIAGGAGSDTVRGGAGVDLADFAAAGVDITVDLSTGRAKGEGTDWLFDVENVIAGDGDDKLSGSAQANALNGGAGEDSLSGGGGDDLLTGCVDAKGGGRFERDTLSGGAGGDVFELGWSGGRFYDDGDAKNWGRADFVLITDFAVGRDRLQLDGSAGGYYLAAGGVADVVGTGLYAELGATDELIAIIRSADGTALTAANTISPAVFV
jgi:Ca2+-binding RTX toxin-like protein